MKFLVFSLRLSVSSEWYYGVTLMLCFPAACSSSIRACPAFLLWYKACNALPWACSHTHAWNKKGHFFFLQRRRLGSSTQPNVGVNACFLCACRAVCFDLDALDSCCFFFILAIWSGEYFPSGDSKLPSWQQKKQHEAPEELLLNFTYSKTEDSWRS